MPGSVAFEIVDNGGTPGIVVGAVSGPSAEVGRVEIDGVSSDSRDDDHDEREAKVRIRFSQDGQTRWLTIKAEVDTDDGATRATRARVRISLSKVTTALVGTDAIGAQTWNGVLCDGAAATIRYTVTEGGAITIDEVSPAPERQRAEGNGVEVRFATGERVRIRVRQGEGGTVAVKVDEKLRCDDAPQPTLNVPVVTTDDSDDDSDDAPHGTSDSGSSRDRNGKGGGNSGRNGRGGDDKRGDDTRGDDTRGDDDDDSNSGVVTSVPTATTVAATVVTVASDDSDDDSDDSGRSGNSGDDD